MIVLLDAAVFNSSYNPRKTNFLCNFKVVTYSFHFLEATSFHLCSDIFSQASYVPNCRGISVVSGFFHAFRRFFLLLFNGKLYAFEVYVVLDSFSSEIPRLTFSQRNINRNAPNH